MIYLDNAATSWPKPDSVWNEVVRVGKQCGANPGRAGHQMAIDAGRVIYGARVALARLLNLPDPLRVVFTANATEALNLALLGLLNPGDHVLTTSLEHNSVVRPLRVLQDQGVQVTFLSGDNYGVVCPADLKQHWRKNTRALVFSHGSNVTGVLQDALALCRQAKELGLTVIIDVAQTAGTQEIDVAGWGVDLLAFPGHKGLFGPQGTGGLWVGPEISLRPLRFGGTGSQSESEQQPAVLPDRFESGTPNTPGIAGLAAGVAFIEQTGRENIEEHESRLTRLLWEGLAPIPGVTLYGPPGTTPRAAVISLTIEGLETSEVGFMLDKVFEIGVRTGLHCAPLAHRKNGTLASGTVRISPGYFNTTADIRAVIAAIEQLAGEAKQNT
ncbi:MAG: aminotransferase class V-fold PLP-dependent enzyme [Heliobacteriaceae bacterium]|nr:aminotransferase class V-fold PLP-dependent enzyme [Heliobacteriaceae bacterium]